MILSREQAQHIATQISASVELFGETFAPISWGISFTRPEGTTIEAYYDSLGIGVEELENTEANMQVAIASEYYDTFADFCASYKL